MGCFLIPVVPVTSSKLQLLLICLDPSNMGCTVIGETQCWCSRVSKGFKGSPYHEAYCYQSATMASAGSVESEQLVFGMPLLYAQMSMCSPYWVALFKPPCTSHAYPRPLVNSSRSLWMSGGTLKFWKQSNFQKLFLESLYKDKIWVCRGYISKLYM